MIYFIILIIWGTSALCNRHHRLRDTTFCAQTGVYAVRSVPWNCTMSTCVRTYVQQNIDSDNTVILSWKVTTIYVFCALSSCTKINRLTFGPRPDNKYCGSKRLAIGENKEIRFELESISVGVVGSPGAKVVKTDIYLFGVCGNGRVQHGERDCHSIWRRWRDSGLTRRIMVVRARMFVVDCGAFQPGKEPLENSPHPCRPVVPPSPPLSRLGRSRRPRLCPWPSSAHTFPYTFII